MCKLLPAIFLATALPWLAWTAAAQEKEQPDRDAQTLERAGVPSGNTALLQFLEKHSGPDSELTNLLSLVRDLGSSSVAKQDRASAQLLRLGLAALEPLRHAQRSAEPEVAKRARECAQRIVREQPPEIAAAVIRLLARRQPPEASRVLLRYLPYAGAGEIEEEVWRALDAIAARGRKLDPVFEKSHDDPIPPRRAAAAYVLGRRGGGSQRTVARQFLADEVPVVRLRAAQGLLGARDKTAIPTLIELLDTPTVSLAWQGEELLHWAADDGAPEPTVGAGSALERKKCREAWQAWWMRQGPQLDLAQQTKGRHPPGLLLVWSSERQKDYSTESRVMLCGCDAKPRWHIRIASAAVREVYLQPGDHLLLAEDSGAVALPGKPEDTGRVAERDLHGKILWQYTGSTTRRPANRFRTGTCSLERPTTWRK
jgi:hypothetical protein